MKKISISNGGEGYLLVRIGEEDFKALFFAAREAVLGNIIGDGEFETRTGYKKTMVRELLRSIVDSHEW